MGTYEHRDVYDNGYVAEILSNGTDRCESWLLLPAENLWPAALRGILYIVAIVYFFVGIAIASDVFMCSIEMITSKKRKITRWDEEKQEKVEREVMIWNETVANLTLMALGSSAPEILLATIETATKIGSDEVTDSLGTFTIIGSAAFNLLIITSICIISVPTPDVKRVHEFGVFLLTAVWSLWAYVWMLLAVQYISPGVIDPWEAWLTLAFFPMFVGVAYLQDQGWYCKKKKVEGIDDSGEADGQSEHVRVMVNNRRPSFAHAGQELHVLEDQKARRASIDSIQSFGGKRLSIDGNHLQPGESLPVKSMTRSMEAPQAFARARYRFRHAAVSALIGGRQRRNSGGVNRLPKMAEIVTAVQKLNEAAKAGKFPEAGDLYGKFTFASDRYAVLESAGVLEIDVLFHRSIPPKDKSKSNGVVYNNGSASSPSHSIQIVSSSNSIVKEVVSVEYETREGSAKAGKDFRYSKGTLTFNETEYRKTITVPIINDNQFENDSDFYIILKNAHGGSGLGDPSVARVTIIDDDEPGEFLFEESHTHADMKSGKVNVKVIREHGSDGKVSLEYSTIDGTAIGGDDLESGADYVSATDVLKFSHNEMSKIISIDVNKAKKETRNFIISIRNPSLGAKIGVRSAVVCSINAGDLDDRIADLLEGSEEDEVITYGIQFANAMTISGTTDDDGKEIPPKWYDYLLHFITFVWKVICACIPPTSMLGAWPSFVISLLVIGAMTAVVEQLGHLLGCVIGLKTSVTGITIIALGTSVPDTFASRTAARQDEHADAAIGNITGSNSVNVFLGLGVPWVLSTMYALAKGKTYRVEPGNLTPSVIIFSIIATICVIFIVLRRVVVGGELGGKSAIGKWFSCLFLVMLWVVYIVLASLQAYGILTW